MSQLVRPRTIIYAALITAVALVFLTAMAFRSAPWTSTCIHDRNPLFVKLSDGSIRNGYTLRVLNKAQEQRSFALAIEGIEGAALTVGRARRVAVGRCPD